MTNDAFERNIVSNFLGALWLLDGLLELQPKMFGPGFVTDVLAPSLSGQPGFMHAIVAFGITLWSMHPIIANASAGLLEILIGVLLLFHVSDRRFKIGLYLSIAW